MKRAIVRDGVRLDDNANGRLNSMTLQTQISVTALEAQVVAVVPGLLKRTHVPGAALALVRDGAIAWVRTFGVARAAGDVPMTEHTRFQAASLGKPVFAIGVLRLAEQGMLDLSAPLSNYLPSPYVADDPLLDRITARSVLGHTTGWPNWRRAGRPLAREREPNAAFGYSGEGYTYLQTVVEQVTGLPLDTWMRETVLAPLGMVESGYHWAGADDPSMAAPHSRRGRPGRWLLEERELAAASLHTTAADLAKVLCAILAPSMEPRPLQSSSVAEMLRPHVRLSERIAWGLGWGLQFTDDGTACWHWGDNPGYKGILLAYPAARLGLVLLTNGDNGLTLCEPLLRLTLGGEYPALSWLANFYGFTSVADVAAT